jgi:transcriptional regulator with XRE-family HTH domain
MGKATREKPARLAEKLLKIRMELGLSQNGMLQRLGLADRAYRNYISDFERGIREPPLPILLKYAQVAGVSTDVLIDDKLDLPNKIPAILKHTRKAKQIRHN